MREQILKVGALARRTGLSVRTLHHWEQVGLLVPRRRTASGHRLYGPAEALRLQQVLSLKQLGLSLDEIRDCLDRQRLSPRRSSSTSAARRWGGTVRGNMAWRHDWPVPRPVRIARDRAGSEGARGS